MRTKSERWGLSAVCWISAISGREVLGETAGRMPLRCQSKPARRTCLVGGAEYKLGGMRHDTAACKLEVERLQTGTGEPDAPSQAQAHSFVKPDVHWKKKGIGNNCVLTKISPPV